MFAPPKNDDLQAMIRGESQLDWVGLSGFELVAGDRGGSRLKRKDVLGVAAAQVPVCKQAAEPPAQHSLNGFAPAFINFKFPSREAAFASLPGLSDLVQDTEQTGSETARGEFERRRVKGSGDLEKMMDHAPNMPVRNQVDVQVDGLVVYGSFRHVEVLTVQELGAPEKRFVSVTFYNPAFFAEPMRPWAGQSCRPSLALFAALTGAMPTEALYSAGLPFF